MAYDTPGPDEIKNALGKKHSDAIPYRDLRDEAKKEYAKQQALSSKFDFTLNPGEVMATLDKVRAYRDQRAKVMVVFKRAIGRLDGTIKVLKSNDSRKPQLESILKVLKAETKGHEDAIEQGNNTLVKGQKLLEALQKKERDEEAAKKLQP